ncbi:MAG: thioesterase family protein [bacterium]|nr:thioesterase family protein [bacterium]
MNTETAGTEFDRAVALQRVDDGRWQAEIQDGWDFVGTPNGGYLLSIASGALIELTGRPDPITITAHYLAPAHPGPAELYGELVKVGRRHATAGAALRQDGRMVAQVLGTFGQLSESSRSGICHEAGLPDLPPPESCVAPAPSSGGFVPPPITERVEIRLHPAPGWLGEWFTTDHIAGGYLEEDGVIWDEAGDVVAVSRQMAILPR